MVDPGRFEDVLEDILKPVTKKAPAGRPLAYDSIYDDIRRARTDEDDALPQGIWERPLKKVNWRGVESLCIRALSHDSKDLQIMAWLTEAWLHLYPLEGLQYGLQGISKLCQSYWETLYPLPREKDIEFRLAPFEWIDDKLLNELRLFPMTLPDVDQSKSYTLVDWQSVSKLAGLTGRARQEELKRLQQEGRITLEEFNASRDNTPDTYYQKVHQQSQAIIDEIQKINEILVQKKVRNTAVLYYIRDEIKNIMGFVDLVLKARGLSAPSEISKVTEKKVEEASHKISPAKKEDKMTKEKEGPLTSDTLKISNREEAYKILDQVADYLSAIEPHSPTPLLIRRAIGWGKMSLAEVLQELVQDKGDLLKIQNLLGGLPKST